MINRRELSFMVYCLVMLALILLLGFANVSKVFGQTKVNTITLPDSSWEGISTGSIDAYGNQKVRFKKNIEVRGEGKFQSGIVINDEMTRITNAWAPNAATYDSVPTWKGTGTDVHCDVVYSPYKWNGYRYWSVASPWTELYSDYEEPNIIASNDGRTWVVPVGTPVPLDTAASGEHLADPELFFDRENKLWCIWVADYSDGYALMARYSSDSSAWSVKQVFWSLPGGGYLSPCMLVEDTLYRLYYSWGAAPKKVMSRTSKTSNWSWSTDVDTCTFTNMPTNFGAWHQNIVKYRDLYILYMFIDSIGVSSPSRNNAYLAVSTDGKNFTFVTSKSSPFMYPGVAGQWDDWTIYRSTILPLHKNGRDYLAVWYTAFKNGGYEHRGYTEAYLNFEDYRFSDFSMSANNPEDSMTVWYPQWESDNYPTVVKVQNESGQNDLFDTLIFTTIAPEGLAKIFDSLYTKYDSLRFDYKTSSTDTTITGVRFRIFKQSTYNGDTVAIYGGGGTNKWRKMASASVNAWQVARLYSRNWVPASSGCTDSLGSIRGGLDIIQMWVITNLDAGASATFTFPQLFGRREK